MSKELKWSMAITVAGLTSLLLECFDSALVPHDGIRAYGAVTLVGVVGIAHVAYQALRDSNHRKMEGKDARRYAGGY